MKKFLTLPFFLFPVCMVFAQLTSETITINGTTRNYKMYVPAGFDAQTESPSLVLVMHGLGSSSSDMVGIGFNQVADTARIIVFYPDGVTNGFGQSSWNNGTLLASTADDISFLHALINRGESEFNVDPTRVYATGFSMGSIMSHHIACFMNQRIAAIGAMSGTMSTSDIQNCVPAYKTRVIHLHGTADGTVPYNSNALPSLSLVPETIAFWQGVHGCLTSADSIRLNDVAADNITIDRFVYQGCDPDGSLEHYRLNGAGHQYLYQPVNDITEMLDVWRFLRQWQHTNPSTLEVELLKKDGFTLYPNPAKELLTITVTGDRFVRIRNVAGQEVYTGSLTAGENQLDVSVLDSGIYFVTVGDTMRKLIVE